MRKKLAVLLLSMSILGLGAGCSGKEETDTENTQNTAQETEEESVVNSEGLVVAVDVDNLEDYVTLGQYQNLTVEEEPKEEVTQEDVDDYVERQLIYNYAPVEVTQDRAVQENDTVNIDFTGYMDGETFSGGSAQDQDLIIGSDSFIDGFEDGLIGHKKGETVTLDLSFPENYRNNPDLSGKPVTFEVTINSISEPTALTDEWAAANTDYPTAEEFKNAQKELLVQQEDSDYESQVKSDLFQQVMNNSQIKDYPEEELDELKSSMETQMDQAYTAAYGMGFYETLEAQGISKDEASKNVESMAESYMAQYLVTQAVLDAEGVSLTEADYEKALDDFAKLSGFQSGEEIESNYGDIQILKNNVLWNVACDKIMETATITEKAADDQTGEAAQ